MSEYKIKGFIPVYEKKEEGGCFSTLITIVIFISLLIILINKCTGDKSENIESSDQTSTSEEVVTPSDNVKFSYEKNKSTQTITKDVSTQEVTQEAVESVESDESESFYSFMNSKDKTEELTNKEDVEDGLAVETSSTTESLESVEELLKQYEKLILQYIEVANDVKDQKQSDDSLVGLENLIEKVRSKISKQEESLSRRQKRKYQSLGEEFENAKN